ncbi:MULTISPECIES: membrane integrity-associated transporter subunit PqiC [Commensalibacter]|uniref:PqiC family protein n=1 Tax=Commensalibacter TaxID=1079922 RepID=UPI0012D86E58|nr:MULTISPECIES: ABC-type transport auxiliary lipoprotein family protein [Commensalibacter]MBH9970299.1 membrane integrity-associated transporter subunit PqiC [Commensalibacter sp. M0265]MBH9977515.1 membrane integrity-associated transporter subunit PqiC [Commensalibacter sp. M0266]MBH9993334.1 membrane integrity-associated transporter subunit PqiC [Commensalibacter sp. M0270]MBI0046691.1 membrane integrity-associated transporter subunit PqiC [Commensalibacter sp. M0267]MBI0056499.1 membrane i
MNKFIALSSLSTLFILGGCSAPPLKYYTFNENIINQSTNKITQYSETSPTIIITPITVPDYLDTTDIVTRENSNLHHSVNGRMSSVLSVAVTDYVTHLLSVKNPTLFITNQRQVGMPTSQILINISHLDVQNLGNQNGSAILEADWSIIPRNEHLPINKQKGTFFASGSIASDSDVIKIEQALLIQLVNQISKNPLY